MKKKEPEINLNDLNLMDQDLLKEKKLDEKVNFSYSSSDNNNEEYFNNPDNLNKVKSPQLQQNIIQNPLSCDSFKTKNSDSVRHSSSLSKDVCRSSSSNYKKNMVGNKRKRSKSRKISYSKSSSVSSSPSKNKFHSKLPNEMRRSSYYGHSNRNNGYYENNDFRKFDKYNRNKTNNHDYNENIRKRIHSNYNYSNKYNESKIYNKDNQHSRYYQNYSPNYSNNKVKQYQTNKNNFNDMPAKNFSEIQKEIKEDFDANKSPNTEHLANSSFNQKSGENNCVLNRRKYSQYINSFSDYPNSALDKGKDYKQKISKFSDVPTSDNLDDLVNKDNTPSYDPYFKNKYQYRNNNFKVNYNKNNRYNTTYRYESIYDNLFHKRVSEAKDKKCTETKKDDEDTSKIAQADQVKKENPEKITDKITDKIVDLEPECKPKEIQQKNENQSSIAYVDSANLNKSVNLPNKQEHKSPVLNLDNKSNSSPNEKNILIQSQKNGTETKHNSQTITSTSSNQINTVMPFNNNLNSLEIEQKMSNLSNIITNNNKIISPVKINTYKPNNSLNINKEGINNIVNLSTSQRLIITNPSIKINNSDGQHIPTKINTDISAIIQKDYNLKIINVLGKKKIILNKERKNPDIKIKKNK